MNGDLEAQLRSALEEMASLAPQANPVHPRPNGPPARRRPHVEVKTLAWVGCLLLLIGTLVAIGVAVSRDGSPDPTPVATTPTLAPTTSLPQTGPYTVPDLVGLTGLQALMELRAAGLTNSIDAVNCPGSFLEGEVIGQNPPAGFRAAADSRVNLRISCGGTATTTGPG